MRLPGAVEEVSVLTAAAEVGLDLDRLKADKNEPAVRAASDRNLEQARALRISGAPSFVVGVEIVRGAVEMAALQAIGRASRRERLCRYVYISGVVESVKKKT